MWLKVYAGYVIEDGEINREATAQSDGVKYTKKVDIWALGIILYQIVFGSQPFSNVPGSHNQILSGISMLSLGGKVSKMKAIANPKLPVEYPPLDNLDEDLLVHITPSYWSCIYIYQRNLGDAEAMSWERSIEKSHRGWTSKPSLLEAFQWSEQRPENNEQRATMTELRTTTTRQRN